MRVFTITEAVCVERLVDFVSINLTTRFAAIITQLEVAPLTVDAVDDAIFSAARAATLNTTTTYCY